MVMKFLTQSTGQRAANMYQVLLGEVANDNSVLNAIDALVKTNYQACRRGMFLLTVKNAGPAPDLVIFKKHVVTLSVMRLIKASSTFQIATATYFS